MVWVGCFHCEYGNLWNCSRRQAGRQPGDAQQEVLFPQDCLNQALHTLHRPHWLNHPVQVLPATLHAGLWILHQGLVSDLRRPLLRIHSGQLTGRIQGLPRYKPQKTILTNFYLICKCLDNAIPIKSWFNDPSDTALLNLLPVLDALRFSALIIVIIKLEFSVHEITRTPFAGLHLTSVPYWTETVKLRGSGEKIIFPPV